MGADILRNLRGQREQIEHTRDTVSAACPFNPCGSESHPVKGFGDGILRIAHHAQLTTADSSIDRASGTLKKMIFKQVRGFFLSSR